MYNLGLEINRLDTLIEGMNEMNREHNDIVDSLTKVTNDLTDLRDYKKEMEELLKFLINLNNRVLLDNKSVVENKIDNLIKVFFPVDNFTTNIELGATNKGEPTAILKIGKNYTNYKSPVYQNGDFMQQFLRFVVYEIFLALNESNILLIDEGFSNSDEDKPETIAKLLDNINIPYKVMIEHRQELRDLITKKNIINLKRNPNTNEVMVL